MGYKIISEHELTHYGIKGQKWGVRRFQNPDGSLTTEGKERYRKSSNLESVGEQNSAAMAAFLVAHVVLPLAVAGIAAGAMKISENKADKRRDKAEERVKNAPRDKKTKMPLKEKESTAKEDLKNVNPGEHVNRPDTQNNCGYCTITYDLRRRGYDVIAPLTAIGTGGQSTYDKYYNNVKCHDLTKSVPHSDILKKYDNPVLLSQDRYFRTFQKELIAKTKTELLKQPEGSRGFIGVSWASSFGGHSMAYEIRNGKVIILDSQHGAEWSLDSLSDRIRGVTYARLDNATPKYDAIRKDWGIS